jgi:hypothetical protein
MQSLEPISVAPSALPDLSVHVYQVRKESNLCVNKKKPSIVIDRKKMLQEKLSRKPPLSMRQRKYLQQMERLLEEEIFLIKSKLSTMQDKLKTQKSLKVKVTLEFYLCF